MSNLPTELQTLAKSILNEREQQALEVHLRLYDGGKLSSHTIEQFYSLFQRGVNCEEIHKLNKAFPYGAILEARLEHGWDARRDQDLLEKQVSSQMAVKNAQFETAEYLASVLAAQSKMHGARIKKYIQTGNSSDLGDSLKSIEFANMGRLIENLLKITGQDKNVNIKKKEELDIKISVGGSTTMSPEDAAKVLEVVAASRKKT